MKTTLSHIAILSAIMLMVGFLGCSPADQKTPAKADETQASAEKNTETSSPMAKGPEKTMSKEPVEEESHAKPDETAEASAEKADAAAAKPAADDALTRGFKVTGMHCSGCEHMICTKLKAIEGVKSAQASHKKERVVVMLDGTKDVTDAELMMTIEAAGGDYKAEPLPKE